MPLLLNFGGHINEKDNEKIIIKFIIGHQPS